MAGGNINGYTGNKYIAALITWSASTNTDGNYSTVTANLYYRRTNTGYHTYGTCNWSINIDGNVKSGSTYLSIYNDWVLCGSHSATVYHNADGTRNCWIGASGGIPGLSFNSTTCGATVGLDTIPRASQPSINTYPNNSPDIGVGIGCTIHMNRHSTSFTHNVSWRFGNKSGTIANGVTDNTSWTPPLDMLDQIPNSYTGVGNIVVDTYSGSTYIGEKTCSFTLYANNNADKPSIDSVSFEDQDSKAKALGFYVQNISKIKTTISASGKYGATIKSYSATVTGSGSYSGNPFTANIYSSGAITFNITVTDTRGNTSSVSKSVSAEPYGIPTAKLSAIRANQDGSLNEASGTYIKLTYSYNISSVESKNANNYTLLYSTDGSSWKEITKGTGYSANNAVYIMPNADEDSAYQLRIRVKDSFNEAIGYSEVDSCATLFNFGADGTGAGFGGVAKPHEFYVHSNRILEAERSIIHELKSPDGMWDVGGHDPSDYNLDPSIFDYCEDIVLGQGLIGVATSTDEVQFLLQSACPALGHFKHLFMMLVGSYDISFTKSTGGNVEGQFNNFEDEPIVRNGSCIWATMKLRSGSLADDILVAPNPGNDNVKVRVIGSMHDLKFTKIGTDESGFTVDEKGVYRYGYADSWSYVLLDKGTYQTSTLSKNISVDPYYLKVKDVQKITLNDK